MLNESFDCDAALTALEFAFEKLALRQLRDADDEREVDNLERKTFRLEACLRAVNLKLEQLLRDAARQESAILRELERQINLLMQELSKAKEEATELEQQFASVEAKCDELKKQNDDLRNMAAELEKEVEELKWQDTDSAAGGFNTKELLKELRFESLYEDVFPFLEVSPSSTSPIGCLPCSGSSFSFILCSISGWRKLNLVLGFHDKNSWAGVSLQ
ncbi:hypothetical protein MRX96_046120 [Rhipicephalus microplus]